jgi:Ni,Fe-hydrogenase I small subunit
VAAVGLGSATPRPGWSTFPGGYICLDYQTEVNASAGDQIADYIENLRNGTEPYFVGLSGAIPLVDARWLISRDGGGNFDVGQPMCISGTFDTAGSPLDNGEGRVERSIAEIIPWLATGTGFSGLVSFGTCASYGGIPSARGSYAASTGAYNYIVNFLGLGDAVTGVDAMFPGVKFRDGIINVPGCAPHPDWMIYPIAHILLGLGLPPLDTRDFYNYVHWKKNLVWAPQSVRNTPSATYGSAKGYTVHCDVCEKYHFDPAFQCVDLGAGPGNGDGSQQKEFCTRPQGCNGFMASSDCPTRMWNNFDDHTPNNWCVGANYVCQGCTEPDFPDGRSPFFSGAKRHDAI